MPGDAADGDGIGFHTALLLRLEKGQVAQGDHVLAGRALGEDRQNGHHLPTHALYELPEAREGGARGDHVVHDGHLLPPDQGDVSPVQHQKLRLARGDGEDLAAYGVDHVGLLGLSRHHVGLAGDAGKGVGQGHRLDLGGDQGLRLGGQALGQLLGGGLRELGVPQEVEEGHGHIRPHLDDGKLPSYPSDLHRVGSHAASLY